MQFILSHYIYTKLDPKLEYNKTKTLITKWHILFIKFAVYCNLQSLYCFGKCTFQVHVLAVVLLGLNNTGKTTIYNFLRI